MQVVAEQVRGAHHPCQVPHHLVAPVKQHPATERSCCGNPSTQTYVGYPLVSVSLKSAVCLVANALV